MGSADWLKKASGYMSKYLNCVIPEVFAPAKQWGCKQIAFLKKSQKNSRWWPDTDLYFIFIKLQTASNDGPDRLPFCYHPIENKPLWRRAELTGLSVQSSDGSWNLEEFLALSSRTNRGAVGTQLPCAWSMISSHVQSF